MLFVIDVGNSHTVTGLYNGKELLGTWRLSSDRKQTADELATRYHTLFTMEGINTGTISGVVIASVVPRLEAAWLTCCQKYFFQHLTGSIIVISHENVSHIISIQLPNPDEVGADRLVNAIAAYTRHQNNLVVVDFGTAITFDCVTERCEYIGGAIMPGIGISMDALSLKTAKLPHIDVSRPPRSIIGKTTVEAMKSGVLHGYGAMIDGMIERISSEMVSNHKQQPHVIATGGMAKLVAPFSSSIDEVAPLLTLEGLKIIYDQKVVP